MSAGGAVDPITMEQARVAAHAHIELTYLTAASMALVEPIGWASPSLRTTMLTTSQEFCSRPTGKNFYSR
jgi:hypothetical protein